jgi:hypothetical protein
MEPYDRRALCVLGYPHTSNHHRPGTPAPPAAPNVTFPSNSCAPEYRGTNLLLPFARRCYMIGLTAKCGTRRHLCIPANRFPESAYNYPLCPFYRDGTSRAHWIGPMGFSGATGAVVQLRSHRCTSWCEGRGACSQRARPGIRPLRAPHRTFASHAASGCLRSEPMLGVECLHEREPVHT